MVIDSATLKKDINTGPLAGTCRSLIASGDDNGIAVIFNSRTGPGAGLIEISVMSRDEFLLGVALVAMSIDKLNPVAQGKWDRALRMATATTSFNMTHPTIRAIMAMAVSDGLMTTDQLNSLLHRVGSRAEVLFGDGALINGSDISMALRGR